MTTKPTKSMSPTQIGQHIADTRAMLKIAHPLATRHAADYIAGFCSADERVIEVGSAEEACIVFAYFDAEVQSGRWSGDTLAALRDAAIEWYEHEAQRSMQVRQF